MSPASAGAFRIIRSGKRSCDDSHGVDFQSVAASGQVVDLRIQAQKDGAVSIEVTETLCDLVTDVACVDVGKMKVFA